MRIKSFSKINLTLRVLRKLKNGMHNIETNSVLVDLYDGIDITKSKKNEIIFKGKFKKNINIKNNTIIETLRLLKKFKFINNFYRIIINKNIPVYAGLGGGTGNSVSIIKYLLKKKLNEKIVSECEKKIGSDFRLFLNNFTFQKGLGKVFKNKNKFQSNLLIIFPNIHCKTKNIYKAVRKFSPSSRDLYLKKINKKKLIDYIKKDQNDLQKIVEKKYSRIANLIKLINNQKGCIFSRMTGSGSACYGVFKSNKTAKFAKIMIKRKHPKYWCVITKTI